jgi:hypothetical protein
MEVSAFDARAGHPDAEAAGMVVAAVVVRQLGCKERREKKCGSEQAHCLNRSSPGQSGCHFELMISAGLLGAANL